MHMWQFDSRFSKAFNVLKESSRGANAKYDVLKLYNIDSFITSRMPDHNKITFAIKYLPMSHPG